MFESNSIIRASAGTGKTFALATRFIRLMLLDRVEPKTIVALTFSRAAAQEIYTKILVRLCRAARDEEGAAREWENLLADFKTGQIPGGMAKYAALAARPPAHTAEEFGRLLRKLVDTLHLGAIATLDSFILRIVRNFPKEMGFQNAVSVLDPIDEAAAVDDAVRRALERTDGAAGDIAEAFAQAKGGDCVRTCLNALDNILVKQGWRNFVLANPACAQWTVASMCAALGIPLTSTCPDLSGIPINEIHRKNAVAPEQKFIDQLRAYDGSEAPFFAGDDGVMGKMARFFRENPTAEKFTYAYYRKEYVLRCGAAGAQALHLAIDHAMNLYLRRQLEIVRAKIALVRAVETEYGRMTRRMGKLTFGDFTKYSAEEEFSARGIAIRNVEFRFDSKFDHWALDEFQDTSELQWRCLRELVQNAAEAGAIGENRSAMVVGDMKQSIYTWRGASAQPFDDIAGWVAFDDCHRDFRDSHRYGPNIAAFVNRVFGADNIRLGGIIPDACRAAVEKWNGIWLDHVSHEAADYVKVVAAPPAEEDEEDDGILPALYGELAELWAQHQAAASPETVGVLVRNNDHGLKVAEYLRAKGLPVVWEGVNPIGNVPVVQAVLALLKLADHPGDTAAWATVNDLIDIRSVLFPAVADAANLSAAVARDLSQQGLARTLKDYCGRLRTCGKLAEKGLTGERLCQLVELGVAFEARAENDGGMDGFLSFVEQSSRRELATSAEVIRILTIHRSKGLGIDHVFVPLFEGSRATSAIDAPKLSAPLFDGGEWVLSHLPRGCEQFNEQTRQAYEHMRGERFAESLRTYYVALTRSKKSLYVILPEDPHAPDYSKGLLMRDLIVHAMDKPLPYTSGTLSVGKSAPSPQQTHAGWPVQGSRDAVARATPSLGGPHAALRQSARTLFAADYGAAARHGLDVHARYEAIEWADEATARDLPEAFRAAFLRPSAEAVVWRERKYELFADGRWETGRFDRVVFTGTRGARRATIYDFKTNALRPDETPEAFAARLRTAYTDQMQSYRRALSRLTGLPEGKITLTMLLESTAAAIDVG
ncbi:MAG: UvrD-helicase domain-containing protein [Kiritimatiellia bacterium]